MLHDASSPTWLRVAYLNVVDKPCNAPSSPCPYIEGVPAFVGEHGRYEFGGIFNAARQGDLDAFDDVVATFEAHYETYREAHPVKALVAGLAVSTGLPRVMASVVALCSWD